MIHEVAVVIAVEDFDNSYAFASLLRLSSSANNSNTVNTEPDRIINAPPPYLTTMALMFHAKKPKDASNNQIIEHCHQLLLDKV